MAKISKTIIPTLFATLSSLAMPEDVKPKGVKPTRIVSLDYCADQYVLGLAERSQIAAVSMEASLSHSYYKDKVESIRQIRPSTDLILSLNPDLVVKSWAGDRNLSISLAKLNVPLLEISMSEDQASQKKTIYDISKQKISMIAGRFGHHEKAAQLLTNIENDFKALKAFKPVKGQALYLTPGAFSTGDKTLMNEIIKLAGFQNYMSQLGYTGWQPIPLERMVEKAPDIMITGFYDVASAVNFNWGIARHDFFEKKLNAVTRIDIPGSYLSCSGLFAIPAAKYLRDQYNQKEDQ
ncbi:ABC transporter substrate-binding protein [Temperatibacter marinus]|uniref:ABC transporter substrate-binding protein n=1 Tax=Temperatibacter marinus TaxID=1456591 RepID=A0AA52HAV2_9PROT|nr:ABC transporter substrate-binding protein [Temperatibacter marinus]WND03982.1 ABC transporter substrate-binding protein [Temperatibacter marinus]